VTNRILERGGPFRKVLGAGLFLALAGCSYLGEATSFDPDELHRSPGWIAVPEVPVVRQREAADCGTAALQMVLSYWKIPISESDLDRFCPALPGKGTRAGDLRDFARKEGLESYLIHGEWDDLRRELAKGHPVIVGLVKRHASGALTHYEVVVAVHPERGLVVTHDPAAGWQQNSLSGFRKEWDPAGYLTLVCFRGEHPPPHPGAPP